LALQIAGLVEALPTQVVHIETPQCDPLVIPSNVDELGDPLNFPSDEWLAHTTVGTANPVCLATDLPALLDFEVSITNLTTRDFQEVWYVADPETTITNFDGEANEIGFPPLQEAFRIDNATSDPGGSHHPLLSESGPADGIWQAGETWNFVLQDYTNSSGLPADAFMSRGVGDGSSDPTSSGSIITVAVPEPGSMLLMVLGFLGLCLASCRRSRKVSRLC
jgi:hypothetical protein